MVGLTISKYRIAEKLVAVFHSGRRNMLCFNCLLVARCFSASALYAADPNDQLSGSEKQQVYRGSRQLMLRPLRRLFLVAGMAVMAISPLSWATDHIIFLRIAPSEARLFISNADGSGERALTQPGALDYNPAWSSSGDWIVFTSERAGSADLYRIHPDGTGLDRLTDDPAYDDQGSLSPDGKHVVFVSTRAEGKANLWVLNVLTRKARPLTSGDGGDFRPSWSPDGKWIAFSSDRGSSLPPAKGRWERLHLVDIYVIRPDGTGLRRISEHGNFCGGPKWTRDSESVIAYCMSAEETWTYRDDNQDGETRLVQINARTGAMKPMAAGPGVKMCPSILASGEIAYLRRDKSANGVFYGNGRQGPAGSDLYNPSWSPDGTHVVYSRYKDYVGVEPVKLWSRNPNYELSTTGFLPAYDPTGDRFAVTDSDSAAKTMKLMIIEEGKPTRTILERGGWILGPQWSRDGRRITLGIGSFPLFDVFGPGANIPVGPAQVAVINADGSGLHVLTSGPNSNAFPSFAPDGNRIVYRTTGPNGTGLRIMNLEDHSIASLTTDYDNFPVWSPRGDLIAFVRKIGDDFEVFTIPPDGKDVNQLTHTKGNDAHLGWSPDGERIVFTSSRMGFKDEVLNTDTAAQPYGEIFVMRYDGTQVEQLTDNQWEDGGPSWQPHKQQISKQGTQNSEAYALYLEGRSYWAKQTRAHLETAVSYFNQAIAKDPGYAMAYAGLADAYAVLPDYGPDPSEYIPKAKAAALKAIELDSSLSRPHVNLGGIKMAHDWDFAGGEAEFKKALELDPSDTHAHERYADNLGVLGGREEEALAEINRAHQLDPNSLSISVEIGVVYTDARRFDEAISVCKKVANENRTFASAHSCLIYAYWGKRMYPQVIEEQETYGQLSGDKVDSEYAAAMEQGFRSGGWQGALTKGIGVLIAQRKTGYSSPYTIATMYADFGDKEQAFQWLNTALLEHSEGVMGLKTDFLLDPLRSDPRFAELVRKVGLPQ
jgi:Tol biopolymer transport system component